MNAPLRHVAVACMLLFGLLLVNVTYLQAVRAENLRDRTDNARSLYQEYDRKRGSILVGGTEVAYSKPTDDPLNYLRVYNQGKRYAHVTGFYSLFDASGIERERNDVLAGTDERLFVRRLVDVATGKQPQGGSVALTLDAEAQRAAVDGLQGSPGAAVALDPKTGDVLAMASVPSYDPNRLASHDSDKVRQAYEELESQDSKPLVNRALSERYPPGSTFKVITSAAALSGNYQPSSTLPAPNTLDLPQSDQTLQNYEGETCDPSGSMTLANALRMSCNTAFANLGMQVGSEKLREQAQKFGFGDAFETPMPSAASSFPETEAAAFTALSAIGQYEVSATPLQMAMVAAGIANDGMVMRPQLVGEIKAPDLETLDQPPPEEYGRALTPEVANQLTRMMTGVVEDDQGTGGAARVPGVTVAGKTGTAQHGEGSQDHAWFISFAPAQNPRVAVAVVVPNAGQTGGEAAAPIAQDIMEAVLEG